MADSLSTLTEVILGGSSTSSRDAARKSIEDLFGTRYAKRHWEPSLVRNALALGGDDDSEGVPYAGIIHPDNPPSGMYGGASIVWFPSPEGEVILTFVVGTRGLTPDEALLMRPGHRRRLQALRRYLASLAVDIWTKPDPALLSIPVPKIVQARFPGFEAAFSKYGPYLYCIAKVPQNQPLARQVVQAFLDLFAYERGWQVLAAAQHEFTELLGRLRDQFFVAPDASAVHDLLMKRRFVVLQGPPGTGKTRLADQIKHEFFQGRGTTIQFHPAITYEDFVIGLSPETSKETLKFTVRPGKLVEAAKAAKDGRYLLVIDEINRADLSKILGEAIYLFEAGEIGGDHPRTVDLVHPADDETKTTSLSFPENLYVLGTMNTADRSISGMDLAVRRRFSFVSMPPQRSVIEHNSVDGAVEIFDMLVDVFIDHAPEDALDLLPGHSYFLATTTDELHERLKYELLPLLDEYLREGYLGAGSLELHAVRDVIENMVSQ